MKCADCSGGGKTSFTNLAGDNMTDINCSTCDGRGESTKELDFWDKRKLGEIKQKHRNDWYKNVYTLREDMGFLLSIMERIK